MITAKSPHQQLYDALFYLIQTELGYAVYDSLPGADAGYPFVYLGEQTAVDEPKKTMTIGTINQTIHLYGLRAKRAECTTMAMNVLNICNRFKGTADFQYFQIGNPTTEYIPDNTADMPLIHIVIGVTFRFI